MIHGKKTRSNWNELNMTSNTKVGRAYKTANSKALHPPKLITYHERIEYKNELVKAHPLISLY